MHTKKFNLLALIILIISLALLISGCGASTNIPLADNHLGKGQVATTIYLPSGLSKSRTIGEIKSLRLTVTAGDIDPVVVSADVDPSASSLQLSAWVKAGTNRLILVEALSGTGVTLYNQSATVNVEAAATTTVQVVLEPVNATVTMNIYVHEGAPGLAFTYVPPIGSFNNLKGIITGGADPSKLAVAVYIKVGNGYWIKPYFDTPLTFPNSKGEWECDITTGGSDSTATEIAAFLVLRTATVPTTVSSSLPSIPSALAFKDQTR